MRTILVTCRAPVQWPYRLAIFRCNSEGRISRRKPLFDSILTDPINSIVMQDAIKYHHVLVRFRAYHYLDFTSVFKLDPGQTAYLVYQPEVDLTLGPKNLIH